MSIDRTARLKNLHLYGMAAAWSEWQAEYASSKSRSCRKSGWTA